MLEKAKARRRGQPKTRAGEEFPLLDLRAVTKVFSAVPSEAPKWRRQLGALMNGGREKLGAAYSAVARVVALQREALQDRFAEKRDRGKKPAARSKKRRPSKGGA